MDGWSRSAIWWQVYPFGFLAAEPTALPAGSAVTHRLRGLEPALDYLIELGCNGLALNPIFASETHGYDIVDHFRVDPRLGDLDDVDWLLEACRTRGIRVLFDGVFNHVGRSFPAFQDVLANREKSAYVDWFHIDWDGAGPDGFSYSSFEGHDALVELNHESTAVIDHVATVLGYWLDRGVDGWRLDAAYAVPLDFWATVMDRVKARHPEAWFVGEVIHGDYAEWILLGGLDSVTQYELWKSIWSSLNDGNFHELAWTLERHNTFCDDFSPLTFLGNHDVTRIASKLDDPRSLGHALAVLLTVPGIPSVYYGDEQGFRGVKEDRFGGDDAVRPAFDSSKELLDPGGWSTFHLHQDLIGLRRRHPWLVTGRTEMQHLTNDQVAYDVLGSGGEQIRILLNIADVAYQFPLEGTAERLLSDGDSGGEVYSVGPHGWAILRSTG